MIAVAVQARGRDERGQTLDQFQGREPQLGAPIRLGPGEAIDELVVGGFVVAKDAAQIAGAISTLVSDAELRQANGRTARERSARQFSVRQMLDAHTRLYVELLT